MTISRSKNGPTRYKVEVGGWSLTVYRSSLLRALEAVVVILVSFLLFRMGQAQALHERGHEAIGGEYLLLGLPVLYYLLRAVLKDYLADRRPRKTIVIFDELHGLRDRNLYEAVKQSTAPHKDLINAAEETETAFCKTAASMEEIATAFKEAEK